MVARRGFFWLVAAALIGLLPALLLAGHATRTALEQAALARLTQDATALAAALQAPRQPDLPSGAPPQALPPALPPGALVLSAEGSRLAGDPALADRLLSRAAPGEARRLAATPLAAVQAGGLLAVQPLRAADGTVLGAVALWRPAASIEAKLVAILLHGLRDAGLLLLLCLPAAWIGARLLLSPLASAVAGGAALLDALRAADSAAEQAECAFEAAPVLAAAPPGADRDVVAAATAAAALLGEMDATAAAMLQAEAEGVPA